MARPNGCNGAMALTLNVPIGALQSTRRMVVSGLRCDSIHESNALFPMPGSPARNTTSPLPARHAFIAASRRLLTTSRPGSITTIPSSRHVALPEMHEALVHCHRQVTVRGRRQPTSPLPERVHRLLVYRKSLRGRM